MSTSPDVELHVAAESGNVTHLKSALARGANVNVDFDGSTALAWAARGGHLGCVQALLAAGADPNVPIAIEPSILDAAIMNDAVDCAIALINAGADVNGGIPGGGAPLGLASRGPDGQLLDALLRAGANVDAKDGIGRSAADIALKFGHIKNVKKLLAAGVPLAEEHHALIEALEAYSAADDAALLDAINRFKAPVTPACILDEMYARIRLCDAVYLDRYAALDPRAEQHVTARRLHEQLEQQTVTPTAHRRPGPDIL